MNFCVLFVCLGVMNVKSVYLCGRTCFVNRAVFRNHCFSYNILFGTNALVEPEINQQFESEKRKTRNEHSEE